MGNVCSSPKVVSVTDFERMDEPDREEIEDPQGEIYMVVAGLDYACDYKSWAGPPPAGHGPLDTKYAWDMMVSLADQSDAVQECRKMWNEDCTAEKLEEAIREVAGMAGKGDYFVFYYTGHGDRLPQDDQDEEERMDNCLCLVGDDGCTDDPSMTYRQQVWMRDDDLAEAICQSVAPGVKVLCLFDCCHSGTMCDFDENSPWCKRKVSAVSISGCTDTQTSAGTGKGGMFSRAMSKAIEELAPADGSFTVAHVYNKILDLYQDNKNAGHTQNITINSHHLEAHELVWPLQPNEYMSPFKDVIDK